MISYEAHAKAVENGEKAAKQCGILKVKNKELEEELILWSRIGNDIKQGMGGFPAPSPDESLRKINYLLNDEAWEIKLECEIESDKLKEENSELKEFCIWMTGCGYDFTQHEYFIEKRDSLLKDSGKSDECE